MKYFIKSEFVKNIFSNVLASILAAISLSFIFFVFSDFIFTTPNLNGKWQFEIHIENSNHDNYKNLQIFYDVIIIQKGEEIYGTGEKVFEIMKGDTLFYHGKNRIRIEIDGYLDNNYLTKDKLNIHSTEDGKKRESSTFFNLIKFDKDYMSGKFESTVANNTGLTNWTRITQLKH